MTRPYDPHSLTSRIVALCNTERGASVPEIIAATGGHPPSVNATVPVLVNKGRLWRTGTRMLRRYFANPAHAQAYAQVFKVQRALAKEQLAQRRLDKLKAARAAARALRPFTHKAPNATPKPKKQRQQAAKPARTGKSPRLVGHKTPLDCLPAVASVTWPENVQVQRAPVCLDTRFTFTPPPGWLGEFGREWQERRAAG